MGPNQLNHYLYLRNTMAHHHKKTPVKQDCPMEVTLNVLSGKWKPAIISALLREPQRPRDIETGLPLASKRVLLQQLKELEEDGIITKRMVEDTPIGMEYSLTALGRSLEPVVAALSQWGTAHRTSQQLAK